MDILFIQMGGTIDKDYADAPTKDQADIAINFKISTPAFERILQQVNPSFNYRSIEVAKKDSLELDNDDRQQLLDICIKAPEDKIVITHGTDTMVKTGEVLDVIENKTIVITGAMRPERFTQSDAHFNLGTAIGAAYVLGGGYTLP